MVNIRERDVIRDLVIAAGSQRAGRHDNRSVTPVASLAVRSVRLRPSAAMRVLTSYAINVVALP